MISEHKIEIQNRKRFSFGKNWDSLLKFIDKNRIESPLKPAIDSIQIDNSLNFKKTIQQINLALKKI